MNDYLIAKCGGCGAVWAMDHQPDGCVCDEYLPHPDDDMRIVEADNYDAALDMCPWGRT